MQKLLKHGCKHGFFNMYHIPFDFISTYNINFIINIIVMIYFSIPSFFPHHLPSEISTEG